jgi:hypothetical protein
MASITLNFPDDVKDRVINGMVIAGSYQDFLIDGSPNPQTKVQFAKAQIIQYIKNQVRRTEQETKNRETESSVETDITIT